MKNTATKTQPAKRTGAPAKTDGTKKIQVTISVMESRIKKLGTDKIKEIAIAAIEKEFKKASNV